jgi:hypothetical protein
MNWRSARLAGLPKQSVSNDRELMDHDRAARWLERRERLLSTQKEWRQSSDSGRNGMLRGKINENLPAHRVAKVHQLSRVEATKSLTFLTVREAAALLRVSAVTLGRWRIEGRGPVFRKFGRRVVYAERDVTTWASDQARISTSDQR